MCEVTSDQASLKPKSRDRVGLDVDDLVNVLMVNGDSRNSFEYCLCKSVASLSWVTRNFSTLLL